MQLDIFTSQILRDKGIQQAINHADQVKPLWSEQAYNCLLNYIRYNDEFMTEDVREASKHQLSEPPSARAWGGIIVKAVKCGLIYRKGFKNVSNVKAHCTPATLWAVNK
jgi:hypothetical protein